MGNCTTDQVHYAIKQDGQENVKNAAIFTASQKFIDNFIEQIKPTLGTQLKKNQALKLQQIQESKKIIDKLFQDKKIELQTQETGTVQFLANRHNKSFQKISGYAEAVSKINDFQQRAKQIYTAQNNKMLEDIQKYKEDLIFQMEKLKQPLPALMALGQKEKLHILQEVAKHHDIEIQKQNKRLEQQIKSQFEFQQLHRKRVEQWVPASQLNEIISDFEKCIKNIHSQKSNFFSCF